MFADDTACADADADLNSLITRANSELRKIALWFRANKMAVNKARQSSLSSTTEEKMLI
jgi:hypothetical protein